MANLRCRSYLLSNTHATLSLTQKNVLSEILNTPLFLNTNSTQLDLHIQSRLLYPWAFWSRDQSIVPSIASLSLTQNLSFMHTGEDLPHCLQSWCRHINADTCAMEFKNCSWWCRNLWRDHSLSLHYRNWALSGVKCRASYSGCSNRQTYWVSGSATWLFFDGDDTTRCSQPGMHIQNSNAADSAHPPNNPPDSYWANSYTWQQFTTSLSHSRHGCISCLEL